MKLRTRVLALVMSVVMVLSSPMQALAEGEAANQAGDYLEEVYVAVAKTPDEAAKALGEKGYAVLKGADGKPADLNQGANSALKEDRAVVLGYKTTGERDKAITDLAVMGMNGGYSFSDYRTLMAKYRDSQVRPLIERFMATVREYRSNAKSVNAGNRMRADAARELLNHIVEDDSGGKLGDMLLNQTLQEIGVDTASMTEEHARSERAAHPENLDLECALMQGNVDIILLVERFVSMASDTQETTWLQRLSALGPDGLTSDSGDQRPTDAAQEMAAKYQDTAKVVAGGWESLRKLLLDYDATVEPAESDGDVTKSAEGTDVADPGYEVPALEAADVEELDVSLDNAEQVLANMAESMQAAVGLADKVVDAQASALYWYLRSMPYGEGTLFNLFTLPFEDVSADGYEALYPLASVLTPGQVAGLEFVSLTTMAVNGVASDEAFEAMGQGCAGIIDALGSSDVSLYANVNRELFSDKVALTSEALRRGTVGSAWDDLLSLHNFTILSWVGAAVAGVAALATARRAAAVSQKLTELESRYELMKQLQDGIYNTNFELTNMINSPTFMSSASTTLTVTEVPNASANISGLSKSSGTLHKVTVQYKDSHGIVTSTETRYFDAATSGLSTDANSDLSNLTKTSGELEKKYEKLTNALDNPSNIPDSRLQSRAASATRAKYVAAGIFAVMAVISITLTAIDVYNYYNVTMTPIPKYIVDVEDITSKAEDGTVTVVRNDNAYYQVARTDARREGDALKAMGDYADLNGDAGKGWLALYTVKSDAKAPVLASSLKVVTGTSSMPDGYADGIHEFGSASTANLTDSRYTYNDDAGGVYAYFKRGAVAPVAASVFPGGNAALVGGVCPVVGVAAGAGGMYLAHRCRREPAAA